MHSIPCQNDFHTGNRGPIRITTQILRHLGRYCIWIVYWVESTTNWSKTRTAAVHPTARRRPGQVTPKIKWWRLKEDNLRIQFREKELGERRLHVGECSGIVGGDRLGNIESRAGGAWYVNRKETHLRQCDIVVERRSEGCDKSPETGQEEVGNIMKAGRERETSIGRQTRRQIQK